MKNDPIVDEIHQIRKKMWKDCGENFQTLVDRLRKTEEKYKDRVVRSPAGKK